MSPFSLAATVLSFMVSAVLNGVLGPEPNAMLASPEAVKSAEVLFAGDMMFDREIRSRVSTTTGDVLFKCIDPILQKADAVVANLEGPITENNSKSLGSEVGSPNNFVFTFPIKIASLLARHNVRIVNYGNNHILNFGVEGLTSTLDALDTAGVAYFGQAAGGSFVYRTMVHSVPIEFINYNQFSPSSNAGIAGNASTTIAQIVRARYAGYLPVVYAHWGIEYTTTAPQFARDLAHRFVDAGAVAVIGSHPHVVEDHELYKGAPIYYSLGNLIFDQYWDSEVTHGLLLKLTFGASGVKGIQEIPVVLSSQNTVCPVTPLATSSAKTSGAENL